MTSDSKWVTTPGDIIGYKRGDGQFIADEMIAGVPFRTGSRIQIVLITRNNMLRSITLTEHHPQVDIDSLKCEEPQ